MDAVQWDGERYQVTAGKAVFEANNVVVATGPLPRPNIPGVASRLAPTIHQLHSSEYHNPFDLPDGLETLVASDTTVADSELVVHGLTATPFARWLGRRHA